MTELNIPKYALNLVVRMKMVAYMITDCPKTVCIMLATSLRKYSWKKVLIIQT